MNAIETNQLTKTFGKVTAVNSLDLSIEESEIFGFLGPNGAGKSTTIRMLCGILEPTSGTATVGGYDISTEADKVKTIIGYMSQSFGLYQDLTAGENLMFYSKLYIADKKDARRHRPGWRPSGHVLCIGRHGRHLCRVGKRDDRADSGFGTQSQQSGPGRIERMTAHRGETYG